jgi:hypothetical protein
MIDRAGESRMSSVLGLNVSPSTAIRLPIEQARPLLDKVTYAADAYACAEGAEALVIVTEWKADAQPSPRPTLV